MQDWAVWFYKSKLWQQCRDAYISRAGGLCERCLAKGIIKPGVIVHHKTHLTPVNIYDPEVALSHDSLELLCRDCHAEEHKRNKKRYKVDKTGRVTT